MEEKFRARLSYFLVAAKFVVILWVFLVGSFSSDQLSKTLSIIIPLFSVHISIILGFYLDQLNEKPQEEKKEKRAIPKPIKVFSWLFAVMYFVFLITIITLKGLVWGGESFDTFTTYLGFGESIFGVYLGQLIVGLFKKG